MTTTTSTSFATPGKPEKLAPFGKRNDRSQPRRDLPDTVSGHLLRELRSYAFHLGLAISAWDREVTWMTLWLMAPVAGLESSERPNRKPNMGQIHFLFPFLAKAIEAVNLREARNTLSEMLPAAHLV